MRQIGLSEVSAQTMRRAHAVHPICDVQIEYSLLSRGIEDGLLATCRELGMRSPPTACSHGACSAGTGARSRRPASDFRAHAPRFAPPTSSTTWRSSSACARSRLGAAAASLRSRSPGSFAQADEIVALVGSRTRERFADALAALEVRLDDATLRELDEAFPHGVAAGDRYPLAGMAQLDSER